mmetsp:Transcript_56865/g.165105  ORF Transcript_56865/g.165105 Transcript_56865/m.165105 type:complete len:162 (+) Transcript_56865:648-1133(+)
MGPAIKNAMRTAPMTGIATGSTMLRARCTTLATAASRATATSATGTSRARPASLVLEGTIGTGATSTMGAGITTCRAWSDVEMGATSGITTTSSSASEGTWSTHGLGVARATSKMNNRGTKSTAPMAPPVQATNSAGLVVESTSGVTWMPDTRGMATSSNT